VANNGPTSDSEVRRRHSRPWCSIGADGGLSPDSFRAGQMAVMEDMGHNRTTAPQNKLQSYPSPHAPAGMDR
jgi:hypothetical protein